MSNEWHDIAALRDVTDFEARRSEAAPDEILSVREDGGSLESETDGVTAGWVLRRITDACVAEDVPRSDEKASALERIGARFVMMSASCGHAPALNANERRRVRALTWERFDRLMLPTCDTAVRVCEFVSAETWTLRWLGRRVTLLAYAFDRSPMMRAALPSMERIGALWGLSAENTRSAVCAAFVKVKAELLRAGMVKQRFHFWFEKSDEAKVIYAQAQEGNHNRLGGDELSVESWDGIPLRPEWRGLDAEERRRRLRCLAARAGGWPE